MDIVALAINTKDNKCCLIYSLANFDMLRDNFSLYNVKFDSTNWGGCDELDRTLEKKNIELTGKYFLKSDEISGSDYDWGHEYPWTFKYDKIVEVRARGKELLSKEEKDYLKAVIQPFRSRVRHIKKYATRDRSWIGFLVEDDSTVTLPYIANMSLKFKNLDDNKEYSLEDLNL